MRTEPAAAAHRRVPAFQVGLLAFHGTITNFSAFINVIMDLYDRHNMLVGQRT